MVDEDKEILRQLTEYTDAFDAQDKALFINIEGIIYGLKEAGLSPLKNKDKIRVIKLMENKDGTWDAFEVKKFPY